MDVDAVLAQEDAVRQRQVAAGRAAIEKLQLKATLNGYDRNVLDQWVAGGCSGRMPELSFEIQGRLEDEKQQERRERAEALLLRQKRERERLEAEERYAALQANRRRGRELFPGLAALADAEEREGFEKAERQRAERLRRHAQQAREEAEKLRREEEAREWERASARRRREMAEEVQELDTFSFLAWMESQSAEVLEAFARALD